MIKKRIEKARRDIVLEDCKQIGECDVSFQVVPLETQRRAMSSLLSKVHKQIVFFFIFALFLYVKKNAHFDRISRCFGPKARVYLPRV